MRYGIWACIFDRRGLWLEQQVCFIYECMTPPSCHNRRSWLVLSQAVCHLFRAARSCTELAPSNSNFISHLIISRPILRRQERDSHPERLLNIVSRCTVESRRACSSGYIHSWLSIVPHKKYSGTASTSGGSWSRASKIPTTTMTPRILTEYHKVVFCTIKYSSGFRSCILRSDICVCVVLCVPTSWVSFTKLIKTWFSKFYSH